MLINLVIALVAGVFVGYVFKAALLRKYRKRVLQLENEMLSNHARILSLEEKKAALEKRISDPKVINVEEYKRVVV